MFQFLLAGLLLPLFFPQRLQPHLFCLNFLSQLRLPIALQLLLLPEFFNPLLFKISSLPQLLLAILF